MILNGLKSAESMENRRLDGLLAELFRIAPAVSAELLLSLILGI